MSLATTSEIAATLGVTRQRVQQLVKEGMPKVGRNQFDSEAVLAWIAERKEDAPASNSADLKALRARLYSLQGDAQSLRNEVLRGNLLQCDTAETEFRSAFAAIVRVHEQWIAQSRNAAEQERLRELSHAIRAESIRVIADVADTFSRGEDVAPTRVRYGKRVGG